MAPAKQTKALLDLVSILSIPVFEFPPKYIVMNSRESGSFVRRSQTPREVWVYDTAESDSAIGRTRLNLTPLWNAWSLLKKPSLNEHAFWKCIKSQSLYKRGSAWTPRLHSFTLYFNFVFLWVWYTVNKYFDLFLARCGR